jgi:hypothetical protein
MSLIYLLKALAICHVFRASGECQMNRMRSLAESAYDAYVIAFAVNHRAPILTLDTGLTERARDLKLDALEVNVSSRPIPILRRGKTLPRCSRKRNAMVQSRFAGATARPLGSRRRKDPRPRRWM